MSQQQLPRTLPRWIRDIFEAPIWRERTAFRRRSVPISDGRANVLNRRPLRTSRSLQLMSDRERDSNTDFLDCWSITTEIIRDPTPDLTDFVPSTPDADPLSNIPCWNWLCFQELLGNPYWTQRGWVGLCIRFNRLEMC